MIGALARLFREERAATLLGLVRVAVAALLLWNTAKLATDLRTNGYFGDFFHLPLVPEALVPSRSVYIALLGLKAAACLAALLGVAPRAGLLVAAIIGLYMLACDRLQYHNNRYLAHLVALLLAFTPCDRSFLALRRVFRGRAASTSASTPRGPFWAVRLIQLQVTLVYLTSAGAKLLDADWRGGEVMRLRYLQGVNVVRGRGYEVPDAIVDLLGAPWFGSLTSKAAIATELFLAFGLLLPRTRIAALWVGVLFHVGIQIFAWVDLFSWLMLSVYILYATPELRQRELHFDAGHRRSRRVARFVGLSDWLFRYRIVPSEPGRGAADMPLRVVDRDGRVATGPAVWLMLFRTLPLLFPLSLPVRVLSVFGVLRSDQPANTRT